MAYVKWKIVHTKYDDGWSSSNETTLVNYSDVLISQSLGETKDTFTFKVRNNYGDFDDFFNSEDLIEIYRSIDSLTFDAEPFFVGIVKDTPNQNEYNKNQLTVKGFGFSEFILSSYTFTDPGGANMTIPYALADAVAQAGQLNGNFSVTWSPSNPVLKSDDTAFDIVDERFLYKPLRDIFEKYSTNRYTDDGYYYWYVDGNKVLHWKRGDNYDSETYDYTTDPTLSFKYSVDSSKVINYVICRCGTDPAGNAITPKPEIDESSKSKYGTKFHLYIDRVTYAQEINREDVNKSYSNETAVNTTYPDFSSVAFETTWKFAGATTMIEGITCTNKSAVTIPSGTQSVQEEKYTAILRAHVEAFVTQEARALIDLRKTGLNKVDLTFKVGEKVWGLGSRITMNLPMLDSTNISMRVKQIQESSTTTTYSLEEEVLVAEEE